MHVFGKLSSLISGRQHAMVTTKGLYGSHVNVSGFMLLSPRQCSQIEYSIWEMFNIDKTFIFSKHALLTILHRPEHFKHIHDVFGRFQGICEVT